MNIYIYKKKKTTKTNASGGLSKCTFSKEKKKPLAMEI